MPELTKEEWVALAQCVANVEVLFKRKLNTLVKEMTILEEEDKLPKIKSNFTIAGKFLMDNFKPEWAE